VLNFSAYKDTTFSNRLKDSYNCFDRVLLTNSYGNLISDLKFIEML